MKGSTVKDKTNEVTSSFWGDVKKLYNTGIYSFMLVDRVVDDSIVIFSSTLREDFDNPDVSPDTIPLSAQLVKVPYSRSVSLSGDIRSAPWDPQSGTGGILALFASDKIDMGNFSIDATAHGFKGGDTTGNYYGIPECGSVEKSFRTESEDRYAGKRGESILFEGYVYNRGNSYALGGGGGSEGRWAGGAGGSAFNSGGDGGKRSPTFCGDTDNYRGRGSTIDGPTYYSNDTNRIYLGAGGGSSLPELDLTATPGGNGGGIVILVTDTLQAGPGGTSIFARGGSVTDTSFTGGSGGGAGGFILLDIDTVIGEVDLDVRGGSGGNTYDPTVFQFHGPGGGGAGGIVWHNGETFHQGLTSILTGGASGTHLPFGGARSAGSGLSGIRLPELVLPLRGFFFNFIAGKEHVCQDSVPSTILGSNPKGDTLFYFEWQDSTDGAVPQLIPGANTKDYTPPPISETTWYRRIVTQSSDPFESDTSNWIQKTYFPEIGNNLVAPDDTVCYDLAPDPMIFTGGGLTGGDGSYEYIWWYNTDNDPQWKRAGPLASDGVDVGEGFNSGPLQDTSYFFRQVLSHVEPTTKAFVCQNTSDPLTVIVLPSITGNDIDGIDTVCQFYSPNPITGPVPVGGDDNKFHYVWHARSANSDWDSIPGSNGLNYTPGLMDTVTTYYRRHVHSGKLKTSTGQACKDTSNVIEIVVHPEIQLNLVAPDTAVCAETQTNEIYPSKQIIGGDGEYWYSFYESTDSSSWTVARTSSQVTSYDPVELDETTWFFRAVVSGACTDTSNAVKFHVDTVIINNNLLTPDDTICQGTNSVGILGSVAQGGDRTDYRYIWDRTTDQVNWDTAFSSSIIESDLGPQLLYDSTWYRRRVASGVCMDTSASVVVNVHDTITGNLIWMDTVLALDACDLLPKLVRGQNHNEGLEGGTGQSADILYVWKKHNGGLWSDAPAGGALSNNQANYQTEVLTGSGNQYTYYRMVSWGKCSHVSDSVTLVVKPRPAGSLSATPVDSSCYDGVNPVRIVAPIDFSVGLKPFNVYYSDGQGGSGIEVMDTYSGDFSVNRGTGDSILYTIVIDSIIDAYGCVDTMLLASKGQIQEMVYLNQGPSILQDTFSICGDEVGIEVQQGIGLTKYWGPVSTEYTILPIDNPQATFKLGGYWNDTLFYPVTWYQKNGVCPTNSVTVTVELYQPVEGSAKPLGVTQDSIVYFRQIMPLWADTVIAGLGTWTWTENTDWNTSSGGDPITDIHDNNAEIDLGKDNLDKEVARELVWTVNNGICPEDTANFKITRRDLVMYTAFSPNGDMYNEYLILDGLEWAEEFIMKIFSRQMILVKTITENDVFVDPRSGEQNAVWDGRMEDGSEAVDGTYFYMIEVKHEGQIYNYKNFLELVRTQVQ